MVGIPTKDGGAGPMSRKELDGLLPMGLSELDAPCHTGVAAKAVYVRAHGVLALFCFSCGQQFAALQVARRRLK
jgi:hypothetical protein